MRTACLSPRTALWAGGARKQTCCVHPDCGAARQASSPAGAPSSPAPLSLRYTVSMCATNAAHALTSCPVPKLSAASCAASSSSPQPTSSGSFTCSFSTVVMMTSSSASPSSSSSGGMPSTSTSKSSLPGGLDCTTMTPSSLGTQPCGSGRSCRYSCHSAARMPLPGMYTRSISSRCHASTAATPSPTNGAMSTSRSVAASGPVPRGATGVSAASMRSSYGDSVP
mmetsp:Transcript_30079/g.89193  ORF Transcript_30079/g.89193 Transcript_30079/m.89193 type:complete len:225 (+) Transcript_30079:74-748(+)|eukprot:356334-Chlamydomonas_euryale.AAC.2